MRMGRETGGCRTARGVPRLPLGLLAVIVLSFLAWASPLAGATSGGPRALADTQGPVITSIGIPPPAVVPDPAGMVVISAIAQDDMSTVTQAQFFIDTAASGARSLFQMTPVDHTWNSSTETVVWRWYYTVFSQGLPYGDHTLYVQAKDSWGNWGPFATAPFVIYDPNATGPSTLDVTVSPADAPEGSPTSITASMMDWFKNNITAAEFFVDRPGPDGSGTNITSASPRWGLPGVSVARTVVLSLPFGEHTVYVHGRNDKGLWGAPAAQTFTVRTPAFTVRLLADRDRAAPGDVVTYTISFENRGNAVATRVWVNVSLPASLTYVDDTAFSVGGTRNGTDYRFADVAAENDTFFAIRAGVPASAADGLPLDASVSLDYTNALGWDFPAVVASASGSVVAPELAFSVSAPTLAYAGESVLLFLRIENLGLRNLSTVDVMLNLPAWAPVLYDTATGLDGQSMNFGGWRFTDVPPGPHIVTVRAAISADVADGAVLRVSAVARYLSRAGVQTDVPSEAAAIVSRPVFRPPAVGADRTEVVEGARVAFTIRFANEGSAAAESVRLVVALPSGLAAVGGDPPASIRGEEYAWDFSSAAPGPYVVRIVTEGRAAGRADVEAELTYTSPNGVALDRLDATASVVVTVTPISPETVASSAAFAASALGLAVFVATERGKTALLFLFVPLYTRLRHERVLDHETRGMIRGYIVANPGDHYNAIKEALELPNGTLAYHIQVLQKESIVKSVKDGKFRRFYPFEMRLPEGGVPTKIERVILDLIRANPGITLRDSAALLGMTSSTVSYHLDKLEEFGRVEHRREGISRRHYLTKDRQPPT